MADELAENVQKWSEDLIAKSADEIEALEADGMVFVFKDGSGHRNADERRSMASSGDAMKDGSFPIGNSNELHKAIKAIGRATKNTKDAVKAHIKRRAAALGLTGALPESYGMAKTETGMELVVPIWKDESRHLVYGVVLHPELRDSQGDEISADEIEKACHEWYINSRKADSQHDEEWRPGVMPVENFIAPHEMVIGGQPVLKGSWVQGWKVEDAEIWDKVMKDEITGLSIGGSGVRVTDGEGGF